MAERPILHVDGPLAAIAEHGTGARSMSVYFIVGDREIWNPASRAGVLFYDQMRTLEKLAEHPCGLTSSVSDEYAIDPRLLTAFVDAVFNYLGHTQHAVLLALVENVLAVALGAEARVHGAWRVAPERFHAVLEQARVLERTFAGGMPAPNASLE